MPFYLLSSQIFSSIIIILRSIFFKDVVNYLEKNDPHYGSLYLAQDTMVKIGDLVNEAKKQKENKLRILDISTTTSTSSTSEVRK